LAFVAILSFIIAFIAYKSSKKRKWKQIKNYSGDCQIKLKVF
jgi:hypothetical protein